MKNIEIFPMKDKTFGYFMRGIENDPKMLKDVIRQLNHVNKKVKKQVEDSWK